MKLLEIYSYLLANWLDGGQNARKGRLSATDIDAQYNSIFTKSSVKQVYRITGIKPNNLDISFIDYLRDKMFEMNPNVEMNIEVTNHPVKMSVTDEKFTRAFTKAADSYATYKEAFESQRGIARLTGKTYRLPGGGRLRLSRERLDDLFQVYSSYKYLYESVSAGTTLCLVNVFIEIVGPDQRTVRRAGEDLYGILGSLNIGCEIVKSALRAFLTEMGPAVGNPKTLNKKFLPQLLFTSENMSAFTPYKSRGLAGDQGINAILLGVDVRSRLPFSIDIFKTSSAQIFMLLGKSGSGKTYAAFQMALSVLAHPGCHVSALDLKGREWSAIAGLVKSKIISFDSRHSSFVNCMRLDDMQVNSDDLTEAREIFDTAVNGTVQLLQLIVNIEEGEGNKSDLNLVLREAVLKVYSQNHVDPLNPASFKYTAHMKYSDLLQVLESLVSTASYTAEQKHMLHLARSRLYAYLGEGGLFASAFRNEVSLADVMGSPLVIYELNKNDSAGFSEVDVIRTFMIQFLDTKKQAMLKRKGQFLFCFYEELQRCQQMVELLQFICNQTTGARSANSSIILLLNSLKVLQSKEAQDIRSNITSCVVSSCEDNDIRFIRDEMTRPWLARQLELFRDKPQLYRHAFAADIDTGAEVYKTVYRVEIPKSLSERFRTRTVLDDSKE